MTDAGKQSGIALEKAYQFMLWLMPTVEKFPRSQKFLLGDRMQSAALDIIEGLVEATYVATGPRCCAEFHRLAKVPPRSSVSLSASAAGREP